MRVEQLDSRLCACGHFELEHLGGEAFCRADGCDCESVALVRLCGGAATPLEEWRLYVRAVRCG